LWDELTRAFDGSDVLFLTDIYPASEEPIDGIDSVRLSEAISARGTVSCTYAARDAIAEAVMLGAQEGDTILAMGAGDIYKISDELAERFSRKSPV
jgi:UDP-N-acetylmuramate--alanine ligase